MGSADSHSRRTQYLMPTEPDNSRKFVKVSEKSWMSSLLNSVANWRPGTPFYYGWLILALSFLAAFAASGVSQVVFGGIQVYITDDTGLKKSTISIAVTAGTWVSGLLAPFIGRLADRYGPRWLMPVGLVISGISFFFHRRHSGGLAILRRLHCGEGSEQSRARGSRSPDCCGQLFLPPA